MPGITSFNRQMLINVLATALTSTFSAWLSYLAAWSHFSDTSNTALAALLAAGVATIIGSVVTVIFNRYSWILNAAATDGTKVITDTQAMADSLPNNPNVMGPNEVKLVKQ